MRMGVNVTLYHLRGKKNLVQIAQNDGWDPGPVWTLYLKTACIICRLLKKRFLPA